ncbi:MAG: hypothetical protein AB7Q16_21250 [Vicinamibacterales bacterium]
MRSLEVRCDNCGVTQPQPPARPTTWWVLEESRVEVLRTGPLDFCSLACLHAFTADAQVVQCYAADFTPDALARAAAGEER